MLFTFQKKIDSDEVYNPNSIYPLASGYFSRMALHQQLHRFKPGKQTENLFKVCAVKERIV